MKRFRRPLVAASLVMGLSTPSWAQIPVTDVASITNDIANQVETITQWVSQFREWEKQFNALNGDWVDIRNGDLSGVLTSEMRNTFPEELDAYMAEGDGLFGALLGDLARVRAAMSTLPDGFFPADSEIGQQANDVLRRISRQQAAADNTYRSAQRNMEMAERLRARVSSNAGGGANTLQKSAQITARINAEMLAVQSETNRLLALQMRVASEAETQALHVREDWLKANARPVVLPE